MNALIKESVSGRFLKEEARYIFLLTRREPLRSENILYTQSHWNHGEAASERVPMSIDKLCDWGERVQPTMPCFQVQRV